MRTLPATLRILPKAHSGPQRAPFPAFREAPHRLPRCHVHFERPLFAVFFTLLRVSYEASRSFLLPVILHPKDLSGHTVGIFPHLESISLRAHQSGDHFRQVG